MKRLFAILPIMILLVFLFGCSAGGVSQAEYDRVVSEKEALKSELDTFKTENEASAQSESTESTKTETTEAPAPNKFDVDNVTKDLEVTEYQWSNDWYCYAALVVKNNSEFDLAPSIKMVFYDEDDNMIGASNIDEEAFEAGYEMAFVFMNEDEFASYKYEISVQQEKYYDCVLSDLSVETNITDKKAVLSVTNNGDKAAQFVEYTILYFNGNEIVGSGWGYCVDDGSEIKPGKTEFVEDSCYETFDSIKVYFGGRR